MNLAIMGQGKLRYPNTLDEDLVPFLPMYLDQLLVGLEKMRTEKRKRYRRKVWMELYCQEDKWVHRKFDGIFVYNKLSFEL